jgi:phosphoribosylaminoimidazole-succinocarboxamide synthase
MMDKEPIRRWLMEQGFKGDGPIPTIPDEYREELMAHYVQSFRKITGTDCMIDRSSPLDRIEKNLKTYVQNQEDVHGGAGYDRP